MASHRTLTRRRQRKARALEILDQARWDALTDNQKHAEDPFRHLSDRIQETILPHVLKTLEHQLATADHVNRLSRQSAGQLTITGAKIGSTLQIRVPKSST